LFTGLPYLDSTCAWVLPRIGREPSAPSLMPDICIVSALALTIRPAAMARTVKLRNFCMVPLRVLAQAI
jgi:hypothetical protein